MCMDSRPFDGGTRRRMKCDCGERFSTVEVLVRRNTITTLSADSHGRVAAGIDSLDVFRKRVMRAVEVALR